ncbi:MAG: hypothetical protein BZ138_07390 [Methanosphaera sp. rholeuAM270]|nr:MAG: hypothetical protein BZ138_07390 [Methanosphaera sp. rholeuAM270]
MIHKWNIIDENVKIKTQNNNNNNDDNTQNNNDDVDDGIVTIHGIANSGLEDRVGDIITQEALESIAQQATMCNLHLDHEGSIDGIIGTITESELVEAGVDITAKLLPEVGGRIKQMLDFGIKFGLSVKGLVEYKAGSTKEISSWDLTEISLTPLPCDGATMGTVASKNMCDIIKQIETENETMEEKNMTETEEQKATDETITEDAVIELINTAFNEKKDEFLETIREEIKTEYEQALTELNNRIESLESQLDSNTGNDEDESGADEEGEDKSTPENTEDLDKSFDEMIEKRVAEKFEDMLDGILASQKKFQHGKSESRKSVVESEDEDFSSGSPRDIAARFV